MSRDNAYYHIYKNAPANSSQVSSSSNTGSTANSSQVNSSNTGSSVNSSQVTIPSFVQMPPSVEVGDSLVRSTSLQQSATNRHRNSRCRVVSTIEDGLIAPKLPIADVATLTVGVGTIILEVEKFSASSLYSHIAISEVCCARYFMFKSPTIPDVDPHPICNSQVLICPHPA